MNKFKKSLLAGITASILMSSTPGVAAGSWLGAGMSAAGLLYGAFMAYLNGGDVVNMVAGNLDPAQLASEGLVLFQMYRVKDKWDPKPAKEYQQAAASNGGGSGGGATGDVDYKTDPEKLPFQVASLQNVGIEAIGVGRILSEIVSDDTRIKILSDLAALQPKSNASTSSSETTGNSTSNAGAGSCEAKYSVCSKYNELSTQEKEQVFSRQVQNEQNYGTAGLAHAELGLKSVQQAIANDGDSSIGKQGTSSSAEGVTLVSGTTTTVQDLSKIIGTGPNTVAAMKIVSLMNLELAARLNQGNMMQGSILTIEAARAFPNTSALTD